MELSGRIPCQPVADAKVAKTARLRGNGCRGNPMVRRGSPVRVRKRALQKARSAGFSILIDLQSLLHAVGMEPVMDPSDEKLPRIVPRVGVRGRATVIDGFGAQIVVAVDLA